MTLSAPPISALSLNVGRLAITIAILKTDVPDHIHEIFNAPSSEVILARNIPFWGVASVWLFCSRCWLRVSHVEKYLPAGSALATMHANELSPHPPLKFKTNGVFSRTLAKILILKLLIQR